MKTQVYIYYIILAITFFSFTGCGQKESPQAVDFNDTIELSRSRDPAVAGKEGQPASPSQQAALNVCVGSMITPEEGYEYYKKLLDYIARKLSLKVNFIDRDTYAEVNSLLKNKNIDVAFVCGGPYVDGHDEFGLELLCAPQMDGKVVYYSYIIVSKDSPVKTLGDLRGKKFAFVDPMSNSGKAVPICILKEELNEIPETFFGEYVYTYDHDKSIKAVSHRIVDAAAVDSLIWNYMDKKGDKNVKQTRIIRVSDAYGIPPVVVRPSLDLNLKAKLKEILLNMHKEKEGREILNSMFIDKFVEVDDSAYDSIRQIRERARNEKH